MTEYHLDATPRSGHGKGAARKMRRAGAVPGVVYGLNPPMSIQLDNHLASKLVHQLHGSERLISLKVAGEEGKSDEERHVLIKEVQSNPVTQALLHIDFQEIEINRQVQVNVELKPTGTAEGVRLGGVLQAVKHEVMVECLPTAIPEFIEVDVAHLNIGDSLHVGDLTFPEGVRPITDSEETLIVISAPRVEEVEAEEVPEEEEGAEAPAEAGQEKEEEPETE